MNSLLKRTSAKIIGGIIVILILIIGLGIWFVRRPWPKVEGVIEISGISATVTVIRDKWGIPHIYADTQEDLFFTQGYIHAQDRLWQMYFTSRLARGRLSMIFGESYLDIDRHIRTMGIHRASQHEWDNMDEKTKHILKSYSRGVNAYINANLHRLPLEFTILRVTPEKWVPLDTLSIGRMYSANLSGNYLIEMLRERMISQLGKTAAEQLLPPYQKGSLLPISDYEYSLKIVPEKILKIAHQLRGSSQRMGSNNWVIHGSKTTTGMPILANDTHLPFSVPSIWYENSFHGGGFDNIGFTIPGIPLILIGHNKRIGWGVTDLPADIEEVFIEKFNDPQEPTQYMYKNRWYDLGVIEEVIEIKNAEPVVMKVYTTRHGQVLDRNLASHESLEYPEPLAIQSVVDNSNLFHSVVQINLAENWEEFRQAVSYWQLPSEHFVYADIDGNIGYQAAGKIPIRKFHHQGLLPVPGWTGEYEWDGFVAFNDLYSVFNPAKGYYATANDKGLPEDYHNPFIFGLDWSVNNRINLIKDYLENNNSISMKNMQELQADTHMTIADILQPYMQNIIPQSELEKKALALLNEWDYHLEKDSLGASIFRVWFWFLLKDILNDNMSEELFESYNFVGWYSLPFLFSIMEEEDAQWFDDITTKKIENRDDIIYRSFVNALAWLSNHYGKNPEKWSWGRIHQISFRHAPLGQTGIRLIDNIFNTKPIAARGGSYTINQAVFSSENLKDIEMGSAQRFILDFSNWDNSIAINSTGQSGHLFHPHRDDMIDMWENVEYHPMLYTKKAVEDNAKSILHLIPEGNSSQAVQ